MGKAVNYTEYPAAQRVQMAENAIVDLTDNYPSFSGGGKGQKASVEWNGQEYTGKGTSKALAAEDLLAVLQAVKPEAKKAKATDKPDRLTVEDALTALEKAFGSFDVSEETDERKPGVEWSDEGVILSFVPCVGECMEGTSDICECRCDGANHGIAGALLSLVAAGELGIEAFNERRAPTMYGIKPCACGCGGETLRRFIPGHDARYHARQNLVTFGLAQGLIDPAPGDMAVLIGKSPEAEAELRKAYKAAKREARKVLALDTAGDTVEVEAPATLEQVQAQADLPF